MKKVLFIVIFASVCIFVHSQSVGSSPEYIKALTSRWKGERSQDGRPKVSDATLDRLQRCTMEEIWGYLNKIGYRNQVDVNWMTLNSGNVMVGRVVTAQFMPSRPDLDSLIKVLGKNEGRSQSGGNNIWPIDILTKGDVYVADGYLKMRNGTLIGASLGSSIFSKTGKGVIFYGSLRDMQELKDIKGFNAWIKGQDPSFIVDMTPTSINAPIRIGEVTVFPGDVVFANDYGVVFIPAYLVDALVTDSEITAIKEEFERAMVQTNKYLTGEIHGTWSDKVKSEFRTWFINYPKKTSVTLAQIDAFLAKLVLPAGAIN
jgi:regulator of RNase E activity RraA